MLSFSGRRESIYLEPWACTMYSQNKREGGWKHGEVDSVIWEVTAGLYRPGMSSPRLLFFWVTKKDVEGTKFKLCFNRIPWDILYAEQKAGGGGYRTVKHRDNLTIHWNNSGEKWWWLEWRWTAVEVQGDIRPGIWFELLLKN